MINYYRRSSEVTFVQWESDTVLYSHGSACTHIISNISSELLKLIFSEQMFSDNEMLKLISHANPANTPKQNNKYCQQLKVQLIKKELIEGI